MVANDNGQQQAESDQQTSGDQDSMNDTLAEAYTTTENSENEEMFFPPWSGKPVPRKGYTPIEGKNWGNKLYETTHSPAMSRGKTTYSAILYGLDSRGRAVYCTGSDASPNLTYLAPKFHRQFDVPDDARPFREKPPRHGSGLGKIVNAPNNSVLAEVREVEMESGLVSVMARAVAEDWEYIAPPLVEWIAARLKTRGGVSPPHNFPYSTGKKLIGKLADVDELDGDLLEELPNEVLEMMVVIDKKGKISLRRDTIDALPDTVIDEATA